MMKEAIPDENIRQSLHLRFHANHTIGDPENSCRAKRVFRFTIDVSDRTPVTLGKVRSWALDCN